MEQRTWFLIRNQDDTWTLALIPDNQTMPSPSPSPDDPFLIVSEEELQGLTRLLVQRAQSRSRPSLDEGQI